MNMKTPFQQAHSELQRAMGLAKCRKCGCLRGTLENLKASLPSLKKKEARELLKNVNIWIKQLEPLEYPCFGCNYCIPPEAMTILTSQYPSLAAKSLTTCEFNVSTSSWPPVAGEYTVLDASAPVAVTVLASTELEEKLASIKPAGLCIVGKTETENIGVDKIVKNIITNPAISTLIVSGKDPAGHRSGETLLALWKNGVDDKMRVIGSPGRRPILKNVTMSDVKAFRKQVNIENQIGCKSINKLKKRIEELSRKTQPKTITIPVAMSCGCIGTCAPETTNKEKQLSSVQKIRARRFKKSEIKLDRAGYFVIIPSKKNQHITVEHYSYNNELLRIIEGNNSRDIYLTIISNKWITDLSHAAYLGKELEKAELSLKKGFKYVQDGA
jgi:tetrahydromethanopterin S-methyltransferase subunit A